MGPKASTLMPHSRASAAKGCQVCPLSICRQDPRLCDKDCAAGFRLGITRTQKIYLKTNDDQDTPSGSGGFRKTEGLQLNDSRTRGSHRFKQLSGATTTYRDSFFHRTISDWNCLPTQVTDCTTIAAFQASLGSLISCHYMTRRL